LVLGWVIGRGRFGRQNAAREQLRAAVAAQELKSPVAGTSENTNETKPAELTPITPSPKASPSAKKPVAADASNQDGDGLVVYQQGKVIYRQGTAPHSVELQNQPAQPDAEPASPPPQELTPEVAETLIKERVEPNYPERARRQNIEGPVVLDALVNEDGTVQRLKVVNGNSDLAAAAIEAVRRWRFKPYAVKGKAVQFATRITVNFDLPEPVSN
jgi:TonB family protein